MTTTKNKQAIAVERILDEATELLHANGIVGFRLRDLAQNLGVTIPNLYRYFSDRDDIIHSALAREQINRAAIAVNSLHWIAEGELTVDGLWTKLASLIRLNYEDGSPGNLSNNVIVLSPPFQTQPFGEPSALATHDVIATTTDLFRQASEQSLLRPDLKPEACAYAFAGLISSFVLWEADTFSTISLDDAMSAVEALFRSFFQTGR